MWRKHKSQLVVVVSFPIKHTVGEYDGMHGFVVEPDASPNCVARYRIVKRGRRAHDIVVTYTKSARVGGSGKQLPRPKSLRKHMVQMTKRLLHASHASPVGCLPKRKFRLRSGAARSRRADAATLCPPSPPPVMSARARLARRDGAIST